MDSLLRICMYASPEEAEEIRQGMLLYEPALDWNPRCECAIYCGVPPWPVALWRLHRPLATSDFLEPRAGIQSQTAIN